MATDIDDVHNRSDLDRRKAARRFRQLADWAPVSMALFDLDMRYLELTRGWRDDCQIGDRNVIGLSHYEIFPDLPERWKDVHRRCLAGATEKSESDLFLRPDGTPCWMRWEVKPWRDDSGNIGGVVMWTEDITTRKQAEDIVQRSERRFKSALNNSQVTLWEQDLGLRYTWFYNPKLRYEKDAVIGKTDADLLDPACVKELEALKRRVIETRQAVRQEVVAAAPGEKLEFFDLWVEPLLNDSGQVIGIACASAEISELKRVEETLRLLVSEKESLIKEVHHRVKNNLQVITSLLRLESHRSTVEDTKVVLGDMQARIRTMALLHESLYRSGTLASIDLGSYLRQLSTQAFKTQSTHSGAVQLQLDLGSVRVGMDQAVSCGLLVNELITNCLKHGFPEGVTGQVSIDLHPLETAQHWYLRVSDSGIGLPVNFEDERKCSLGLQLAGDLAKQIGGEMRITPNPEKGVSFTVNFQVI
ncbi:MAG: PAS domain S-box protein [Curvibacter sp.]|nr:MAG: PAS domain S-box protein [Curvibacter sp.]